MVSSTDDATARRMDMRTRLLISAATALVLVNAPAGAHHSFAVHYDSTKPVTKEGVVMDFRFTNPHGIILLDVTNAQGAKERWTVETTSPTYMRRSGWNKEMLKPGDRVIVEGWAARDGSRLMRINAVKKPDGTPIGGRQQAGDQ
jgi:hypothetical protein